MAKEQRDYAAEIREDPHYVELKEMVKLIKSTIKIPSLLREVSTAHAERTSPKLWKVNMAPVPIYEAQAIDLRARSRMTEIRVSTFSQKELLSTAIKKTRRHLSTTYREYLSTFGTSIPDRKAMEDRILGNAIALEAELDAFCLNVDTFIKDIDQAGYGLKNIVAVLKVMVEKPGGVV